MVNAWQLLHLTELWTNGVFCVVPSVKPAYCYSGDICFFEKNFGTGFIISAIFPFHVVKLGPFMCDFAIAFNLNRKLVKFSSKSNLQWQTCWASFSHPFHLCKTLPDYQAHCESHIEFFKQLLITSLPSTKWSVVWLRRRRHILFTNCICQMAAPHDDQQRIWFGLV